MNEYKKILGYFVRHGRYLLAKAIKIVILKKVIKTFRYIFNLYLSFRRSIMLGYCSKYSLFCISFYVGLYFSKISFLLLLDIIFVYSHPI